MRIESAPAVPANNRRAYYSNLPPGKYVFFCPVAFGPTSHAKAGQVLSVTVS